MDNPKSYTLRMLQKQMGENQANSLARIPRDPLENTPLGFRSLTNALEYSARKEKDADSTENRPHAVCMECNAVLGYLDCFEGPAIPVAPRAWCLKKSRVIGRQRERDYICEMLRKRLDGGDVSKT